MERYCQMAARSGLIGLPPQSLIATSMKLSKFLSETYFKIRQETLDTKVLMADETPHRMLEGDAKTRWFLWAFSSQTSCFLNVTTPAPVTFLQPFWLLQVVKFYCQMFILDIKNR